MWRCASVMPGAPCADRGATVKLLWLAGNWDSLTSVSRRLVESGVIPIIFSKVYVQLSGSRNKVKLEVGGEWFS